MAWGRESGRRPRRPPARPASGSEVSGYREREKGSVLTFEQGCLREGLVGTADWHTPVGGGWHKEFCHYEHMPTSVCVCV